MSADGQARPARQSIVGRHPGAPADRRTDAAPDGQALATGRPPQRPPADRQPPRGAVRRVACPECGAEEGEPCMRSPRHREQRGRYRVAHHMARVDAYRARAQTAVEAGGAGARTPDLTGDQARELAPGADPSTSQSSSRQRPPGR